VTLGFARRLPEPRPRAWRKRSCARCGSFQNLILERHAFGIVFLKPFFSGVHRGEDLDVFGIATCFLVLTQTRRS
jgi:hypothetical protein